MAHLLNKLYDEAQAQGQTLVALQGDDFMQSVLLKGGEVPWTMPTEYIGAYSQLMSLLKPDVAVFDLEAFFCAWLQSNRHAIAEMRGKQRVRFALKKLLGMEEPREIARDIVEGLIATISQPLLLLLPPNARFVNWANAQANGAVDSEISDYDVDTVSVYFADLLRSFSGTDVGGVALQFARNTDVSSETIDLYTPIANVARHYRWDVAAIAPEPSRLDTDGSPPRFWFSSGEHGNGSIATSASWSSPGAVPAGSFVYAPLPGDLAPDVAASCIASWQQRSS